MTDHWLDNVPFSGHKFRTVCFIQQIQYFLIFYSLCFSVAFNQSKEKFKVVFCYFSVIKNIVSPSPPSNLPTKLIFWGILIFICLDTVIVLIYIYIYIYIYIHIYLWILLIFLNVVSIIWSKLLFFGYVVISKLFF